MAQNKSWKKCPSDEREKFLRNVMDFMTNAFSSSNRTQMLTFLFNGENAGLTNEQRVAKWQFILMDINRDKVGKKIFKQQTWPGYRGYSLSMPHNPTVLSSEHKLVTL